MFFFIPLKDEHTMAIDSSQGFINRKHTVTLLLEWEEPFIQYRYNFYQN